MNVERQWINIDWFINSMFVVDWSSFYHPSEISSLWVLNLQSHKSNHPGTYYIPGTYCTYWLAPLTLLLALAALLTAAFSWILFLTCWVRFGQIILVFWTNSKWLVWNLSNRINPFVGVSQISSQTNLTKPRSWRWNTIQSDEWCCYNRNYSAPLIGESKQKVIIRALEVKFKIWMRLKLRYPLASLKTASIKHCPSSYELILGLRLL